MRRLLCWVSGAVSGVAAYKFLRRPRTAPEPFADPVSAEPDARAEELRARLASSRATAPVAESEPAADEPPSDSESPEERRRRVHEEGRAAIDEMQSEGDA